MSKVFALCDAVSRTLAGRGNCFSLSLIPTGTSLGEEIPSVFKRVDLHPWVENEPSCSLFLALGISVHLWLAVARRKLEDSFAAIFFCSDA